MKQYLNLLSKINIEGTLKPAARENMPGTKSIFGYQNRYNLSEGFPILTTKKVSFHNIIAELLWFLRGQTNIKDLHKYNCHIWDEDAYNYYKKQNQFKVDQFSFNQFLEWIGTDCGNYIYGDCGKQYGYQWRNWNSNLDQIKELINSLRNTPESRRHIVTAWNPSDLNDLALHPCHCFFQMNCRPINWVYNIDLLYHCTEEIGIKESQVINYVKEHNLPFYYLDCEFYQRSADTILGVPYNISSYALLLHILAKMCNMIPGELIHTFGDVHIYENHQKAVEEQLDRIPTILPTLEICSELDWKVIGDTLNFDKIVPNDFKLINYNPQGVIKAELNTGLKK